MENFDQYRNAVVSAINAKIKEFGFCTPEENLPVYQHLFGNALEIVRILFEDNENSEEMLKKEAHYANMRPYNPKLINDEARRLVTAMQDDSQSVKPTDPYHYEDNMGVGQTIRVYDLDANYLEAVKKAGFDALLRAMGVEKPTEPQKGM